jgi:tRNA dimethylallyltransferase
MEGSSSYPLICLVGPTGTGKTRFLLKLREFFSFTVLQIDSRQAILEFDIGTAKPTPEERKQLPHIGVDVVPPTESFSLGSFVQMADKEVKDKPFILLTAGTPMYLYYWQKGVVMENPLPREDRERFWEEVKRDRRKIYHYLKRIDPEFSRRVGPHDLQRIRRAWEIYRMTGKPFSQFIHSHEKIVSPPMIFLGISGEGEEYERMLWERMERMLAEGWVEEVETLIKKYGEDLPGLQGVGYKEIVQWLKGEIPERKLKERIFHHTKKYVRHQRTWFKRFSVTWFPYDPKGEYNDLLRKFLELMKERGFPEE